MGLPNGNHLKVELRDCYIEKPTIKKTAHATTYKMYPAECRSRLATYKGDLQLTFAWSLNGVVQDIPKKCLGAIPVMVKSEACNLHGMKPQELIAVGEEENEFGGYFIINGLEKVVRLLIIQRRNYPIAMERPNWKKRGDMFTEFGVSIRCVRSDQSGSNMVLHYLSDGTVKLMFTYRKELFFVPVMLILKALTDKCDLYITNMITKGKRDDTFFQGCIVNMLRQLNSKKILVREQALNYLGEMFRVKLGLPAWYSSTEVAKFLIHQCICVHLKTEREKLVLLANAAN
ncbi:DNA-directed RNA polymerase I subunit RPA2, partial [Stegodyphus mimosarum]